MGVSAVDWVQRNWIVPETKKRIDLRPWQRLTLDAMFPPDGSAPAHETFLISLPKKCGKTETNSMATMFRAVTTRDEVCLVVANDEVQARDRVFDRVVKQCALQGLSQSGEAVVTKNEIFFPAVGSRIVVISSDWAGAAGGIFGCSSWTETWSFRFEGHQRLWEELTPLPPIAGRRSLRICDTYAGFSGDSPILEPLWGRALAGKRLNDSPPVYSTGKLWALVDQGEQAWEHAWLGDPAGREAYYAEQRATLRPGTFNRLHLNLWQQGEEAFLSAEDWDAITAEYEVPHRVPDVRAFVGVDVGLKHDSSAVVACGWDESGLLVVLGHKIWTPPKRGTLDLASTVEAFLKELAWRFGACHVTYDPSQMQRSAQELRRDQVHMVELPQTTGNLTQATSSLYEIVKEKRLRCYPAPDLRQHVLNSVVVESPRGWRLAKEKASRKIDGAVALSFAVGAAVDGPRGTVGSGGARPSGGGGGLSAGAMDWKF